MTPVAHWFRGLRRERVQASPQWRDGTFHNTSGATAALQSGSSGGVMREFLFGSNSAARTSSPCPFEFHESPFGCTDQGARRAICNAHAPTARSPDDESSGGW